MAAGIPNGLTTFSNGAVFSGPGWNHWPTVTAAMPNRASHAKGRQRRDSGRPSGNSMKKRGPSRTSAGRKSQVASHAATSPPGSEPGSVLSAYSAYPCDTPESGSTSPPAQKIQPIGLRGWRATTSAPTVGVTTPGISPSASNATPSFPGVERFSTDSTISTIPSSRTTTQLAHAIRLASRALIAPPPRSHSDTCAGCIVSRTTARSSPPSASRSTCSRSLVLKLSSVRAASYLRR